MTRTGQRRSGLMFDLAAVSGVGANVLKLILRGADTWWGEVAAAERRGTSLFPPTRYRRSAR
ncbi:hypothetical protein [Nonomuraea dietziae]|uniref:hypothetical protein n=1 Tax=Nonomuraea dietziae TaxID=65515 RepID=UPI0033D329BD